MALPEWTAAAAADGVLLSERLSTSDKTTKSFEEVSLGHALGAVGELKDASETVPTLVRYCAGDICGIVGD